MYNGVKTFNYIMKTNIKKTSAGTAHPALVEHFNLIEFQSEKGVSSSVTKTDFENIDDESYLIIFLLFCLVFFC